MDHRIPRVGVVISVVLAIGALITFIFLNNRFQGPNPVGFLSNPYTLTARFADNKTLPAKQAVLYKGIEVGKVTKVKWDVAARESVATFTLNKDFPIRKDAIIRIGYRSLLGDPYLSVDFRGSPSQPVLKSGGEVTQTKTTVDFDEALSFLDAEGRKHVKSLIKTVAEGTAAPGNGERLNGTLDGTTRTLSELHTLTRTLRGQEQQLSSLVRGANTVLTTIGDRERSIRAIVGDGRTTLDALAANTRSLRQGVNELPLLLRSGRVSLARLQPLFADARPLFTKLADVSPALAKALDPKARHPLKTSVRDLSATIRGLGPLSIQATPVLGRLKVLLDQLVPVVRAGAPGARNLVPALSYLTPRAKSIATGYAGLAAALAHSDSTGHYALLGANVQAAPVADLPLPGSRNPYPGPNDALNPQPFSGPYPRIVPCTVPSRKTPTQPCK